MITHSSLAFGYKMGWLAIRGTPPLDLPKLLELLKLDQQRQVSLSEGIETVYSDRGEKSVFVFTTSDKWIIVISPQFLTDPHTVAKFIQSLPFEVHAFGTHRVSESHYWMYGANGRITRAYGYSGAIGEVTINEGKPTPIEEQLIGDREMIDEEDVMQIAGAWTTKTAQIGNVTQPNQLGYLGETTLFPA